MIGKPDTRTAASPTPRAKRQPGKGKKIGNGLVALGAAAVLSVYGVGYVHTRPAQVSAAETPAIATSAPIATSTATVAPIAALLTSPGSGGTANIQPGTATSTAAASPVPSLLTPAATAGATSGTQSTAAATSATTSQYKDGTYTGTGTSRHGNITATVVVQAGKIVSAQITQCGTRYPCSKIAALPGEVVSRQSAAVDMISGATDSSIAYQGAIQNALAPAAR